ncbi:hypothetical protein C8R44DRAFT_822902, partial [Mycena epipterygia]
LAALFRRPPRSFLPHLSIRLSHLGHLRLNPYATVHSRRELASWLQALAAVLNSAAQRSHCTITVYCVPGPDYDADPRPFLHFIPEVPRVTTMKPAPRLPPKSSSWPFYRTSCHSFDLRPNVSNSLNRQNLSRDSHCDISRPSSVRPSLWCPSTPIHYSQL